MDLISELNDKQKRFCEVYVEEANGARAARMAGYSVSSANVKASKLLTKPAIIKHIKHLRIDVAIRTRTDIDTIRFKWIEIYERCMQGKEVMYYDKADKCYRATGEWQFDASGAAKALENIGKLNGHYEKDNIQKQQHITMEMNYGKQR